MAMNRQSFSEEVSNVRQARDMTHGELSLADAIPDPMETHVYGLAIFGGYRVLGKGFSTFIVASNISGGLGVSKAAENVAFYASKFPGCIAASIFGFKG